MPSSALSGNTSGLATSTSPGLVGTGAQTFAGKKTLDGGAAIKGDTSGSAIAAGYVGEKITFTEITTTTTVAGTWAVGSTIGSLTAGTWIIFGYFRAGVGSGVSQCQMQISNSVTGGSGGLLPVNGSIAGTSLTYSLNASLPIAYVSTSNASITLYPQVITTGATGNAAIGGFAIRVV